MKQNYYVCKVNGEQIHLGELTPKQAKKATRYWNCDTMCVLSETDIKDATGQFAG